MIVKLFYKIFNFQLLIYIYIVTSYKHIKIGIKRKQELIIEHNNDDHDNGNVNIINDTKRIDIKLNELYAQHFSIIIICIYI